MASQVQTITGKCTLTNTTPANSIPVSWLQPMPEGYKIPLWRWILLPATVLMLKRQKGVWRNGTLHLDDEKLRFEQTRLIKSAQGASGWSIPLGDISDISFTPGTLSERLEISTRNIQVRFMTVRAEPFVERLKAAVAAA